MHKFIVIALVTVYALCGNGILYAQDVITLKTGEELKTKVIEITSTEIKYKKYDNQQGPIYTIEKAKIFMIKYENGSKDVFTDELPTATTQGNLQYQNQQQYEQPPGNPNYSPKSPGLAWFLSFMVPGVGQFYNGDVGKGVGFLVTSVVGSSVMSAGMSLVNDDEEEIGAPMVLIGAVVSLGSWIWSQIDAPVSAGKKNRANSYLSWNLGNGVNLALQPEFKMTPTPMLSDMRMSLVPTAGLGLKLSF